MLQIAIHQDHCITSRCIECCTYGGLFAEIAGKTDAMDPAVILAGLENRLPSPVTGTIVHQDQLKIVADTFQNRHDRCQRQRDLLLFIIKRNQE